MYRYLYHTILSSWVKNIFDKLMQITCQKKSQINRIMRKTMIYNIHFIVRFDHFYITYQKIAVFVNPSKQTFQLFQITTVSLKNVYFLKFFNMVEIHKANTLTSLYHKHLLDIMCQNQ